MTISIKLEPELRHTLAHMIYAIEALANGEPAEARYELEEIKGLVFWDSEGGQTADAREWLAREQQESDDERDKKGRQVRPEELQDLRTEGRQGQQPQELPSEKLPGQKGREEQVILSRPGIWFIMEDGAIFHAPFPRQENQGQNDGS